MLPLYCVNYFSILFRCTCARNNGRNVHDEMNYSDGEFYQLLSTVIKSYQIWGMFAQSLLVLARIGLSYYFC